MAIRMRVMDGLEATDRLKKDPATCDIPIIALTASARLGVAKEFKGRAFSAFLPKPVDSSKLLLELTRLMPAKSVMPDTEETSVHSLSGLLLSAEIPGFKQIADVINKELLPEYLKYQRVVNVNKVKILAKKTRNVGTQFGIKTLIQFADELFQNTTAFDVPNISLNLKKFLEWAEELNSGLPDF